MTNESNAEPMRLRFTTDGLGAGVVIFDRAMINPDELHKAIGGSAIAGTTVMVFEEIVDVPQVDDCQSSIHPAPAPPPPFGPTLPPPIPVDARAEFEGRIRNLEGLIESQRQAWDEERAAVSAEGSRSFREGFNAACNRLAELSRQSGKSRTGEWIDECQTRGPDAAWNPAPAMRVGTDVRQFALRMMAQWDDPSIARTVDLGTAVAGALRDLLGAMDDKTGVSVAPGALVKVSSDVVEGHGGPFTGVLTHSADDGFVVRLDADLVTPAIRELTEPPTVSRRWVTSGAEPGEHSGIRLLIDVDAESPLRWLVRVDSGRWLWMADGADYRRWLVADTRPAGEAWGELAGGDERRYTLRLPTADELAEWDGDAADNVPDSPETTAFQRSVVEGLRRTIAETMLPDYPGDTSTLPGYP